MTKNYTIFFLTAIVRAAISFLVTVPLTTWYLDPSDFGLYALIAAVTGVVTTLSTPGFSWLMSKHHVATSRDDYASLLTAMLMWSIGFHVILGLVGVGITLLVLPLMSGMATHELLPLVILSLAGFATGSVSSLATSLMIYDGRAVAYAATETIAVIANVIALALFLPLLKMGVESLFWAQIVQGVLGSVVGFVLVRRQFAGGAFSAKWLSQIWLTTKLSIPAALSESSISLTERYCLGSWASLHGVGIYTHSQRYKQILDLALRSFKSAITAKSVAAFSRGDDGGSELSVWMDRWLVLMSMTGAFIATFGTDIVSLLTHGKFAEAGPIIFLWWLVVVSTSFSLLPAQYLLTTGQAPYFALVRTIGNLLIIAALIPLIYFADYWGAVTAVLLGTLGSNVAINQGARRRGFPYQRKPHVLFYSLTLAGVFAWVALAHPEAQMRGFVLALLLGFFVAKNKKIIMEML